MNVGVARSEDDGHPRDEETAGELPGPAPEQLGQRLGRCSEGRGSPVEGYGKPRPSPPGDPERQRPVDPQGDGRDGENGEEEDGFGAEYGPEHIEISDGRIP